MVLGISDRILLRSLYAQHFVYYNGSFHLKEKKTPPMILFFRMYCFGKKAALPSPQLGRRCLRQQAGRMRATHNATTALTPSLSHNWERKTARASPTTSVS